MEELKSPAIVPSPSPVSLSDSGSFPTTSPSLCVSQQTNDANFIDEDGQLLFLRTPILGGTSRSCTQHYAIDQEETEARTLYRVAIEDLKRRVDAMVEIDESKARSCVSMTRCKVSRAVLVSPCALTEAVSIVRYECCDTLKCRVNKVVVLEQLSNSIATLSASLRGHAYRSARVKELSNIANLEFSCVCRFYHIIVVNVSCPHYFSCDCISYVALRKCDVLLVHTGAGV
jgi:hypothetical protein